ncbi:MAG TPA: MspA family porin, partial [Mycobacterium sp.]|nr:MspA family porin [Mycobacterium sp.]
DLSEGGSLSGGGDIGVGFGFGNSILAVSPSPYAELDGNVSINLLPGNITNVGLGRKALKGPIGEISIHDAHVKVDGCGGPVVMRFFATVTTDTDKSDDSVNTYGDILNI